MGQAAVNCLNQSKRIQFCNKKSGYESNGKSQMDATDSCLGEGEAVCRTCELPKVKHNVICGLIAQWQDAAAVKWLNSRYFRWPVRAEEVLAVQEAMA